MHILCSIGMHRAAPATVWNAGFYFSACARCGREMVRRDRNWRRVPKGYRVVWRARTRAILTPLRRPAPAPLRFVSMRPYRLGWNRPRFASFAIVKSPRGGAPAAQNIYA